MDQIAFIVEILLPALWGGFVVTLGLIACTAPFGVLIGAAVAVGRVYGNRPVQYLCRAHVTFFKDVAATPPLHPLLRFSVRTPLTPFVAACQVHLRNSAATRSISVDDPSIKEDPTAGWHWDVTGAGDSPCHPMAMRRSTRDS